MKHFFFFEKGIKWIRSRLSKSQFLIFSSALIGITAGLAAVLLKVFVHYIHKVLTYNHNIPFQFYLYLVFPLLGILITVWYVQTVRKGKLGRGTANVLYSIAKKSSFLPKDQMYSHILTSGITVGLGGSAGLESPIVTTGSAIGSNYSKTYHLLYKDRTLLLAAGAAAGIAAAFNAPIAGVLFALEVLLVDVSISAFIPLIIASAMGALCSKIILNEEILLNFQLQQAFDYGNIHFYLILGFLGGMASLYYSRAYLWVENKLAPLETKKYSKALVGGSLLIVLIFLFPALFGEGYAAVKQLSQHKPELLFENSVFSEYLTNRWVLLLVIAMLIPLKAIAASITINSGGNGGNFAPSLFVGASLGFVFSSAINYLGVDNISVSNFTIVGMAGVLAGVFYSPLSAIFLIAEITGGYELMIPLMIVSALSFATSRYFEPYSMELKKLAKKGSLLTRNKDKSILTNLNTSKLIETNFTTVPYESSLGELIKVIPRSKRNQFPVINEKGELKGVIMLDDIREIMFKNDMYETTYVKQIMRKPAATLDANDDMYDTMKKFDETGAWNLPVLKDGVYVGFVSKSSIFTHYREKLIHTSGGDE